METNLKKIGSRTQGGGLTVGYIRNGNGR